MANHVFVTGRSANEVNYPYFVGNVEQGTIAFNNALTTPVLNAQSLNRNKQILGFVEARKLKSQRVTKRPIHNHYVSIQNRNSMEQGTICMIDKNGACVPIGHTDPSHTTRTTESMRREYQEIMNDPAATIHDIQRAQQLLRMIHTRESREYLERERLRRERTFSHRLQRGTQYFLNRTRQLRNGALSGIRRLFTRSERRANAGQRANAERRENAGGRANAGQRANAERRATAERRANAEQRPRSTSRSPGGTRRNRRP